MTFAALLLSTLLQTSNPFGTSLDEAFDKGSIVVVATAPACYRFYVYYADTARQQSRGLMFVRSLPPYTGMLFTYPRDARLSFWMRNTYLSLDLAFIRADGSVANIARNAPPLSDTSITAADNVRFVLELIGGASERLGIDEDSRLLVEQLDAGRQTTF